VSITGGPGVSVSPNPITGAGVITNTAPATFPTGTSLIAGCGVEYTTGLTFVVGACQYEIAGMAYLSPQTSVTLMAADMTNPRIDVIGVDSTGSVFSITGTPAASPALPSVDPSTQIGLVFITVAANATTPTGIVPTTLYDENTEWTCTPTAHINCASTSNPYHGTKDIEATAAVLGNNVTLVKPSAGTVDLSTQNNLIFYIRSKAAWPTGASGGTAARYLSLLWKNGSTQVGNSVVVRDGTFGFSSAVTTNYQQVSIPLSLFGAGSTLVTTLEAIVSGPSGSSSIGWYIDEVTLQSGTNGTASGCPIMSFQGTWSAVKAYAPCDTVVSSSTGYVALVANTDVAVTTAATWAALVPSLAQISLGVIGSVPTCSSTTKGVYYPTNSLYDAIVCDGTTNNYFVNHHQAYPTTAGWTVGNGGTLDTTYGYPYFSAPNLAAVAISDVYLTAPAAPYVCTAMFVHDVSTAQPGSATTNPIVGYGMLFRDGTGKIVSFQVGTDTAATTANEAQIATFKWTTDTSFSAAYQSYEAASGNFAGLDFILRTPIWMRIGDDNTNLNFYWSIDGNHWKLFDSRSRTNFFGSGPTQVGFLAYARAGSIEMAVPSWNCQ